MKLFNMEWNALNREQLGRFGECFAKMVFTSYGWYVYTTEVDDHGIDFVVKTPDDKEYFDVQVKSVTAGKDTLNIKKDKMIVDSRHLICYLRFSEGELPDVYVFRTCAWENPRYRQILGMNDYSSPKTSSAPEYNVKFSKKNEELFSDLTAEKFFSNYSSFG